MIHDRYLHDSFNDEFWSNYGIDHISMYKYRRGLELHGSPRFHRISEAAAAQGIGF